MSDLTNPHDKFFKDLFTRREAAQDFLQHYLPAEVATLFDLDSLVIQKDSFVNPELQEHFSDLLYKVALKGGGESYIYVLFEHKSQPETRITLHLLRYMTRVWDQAEKQKEPLLPVLPLVVYHGRQKWQVAREFSALFEVPDILRPYLPEFRYHLADLSQYSDEEIKTRIERAVILQIGLLSLKYIYAEDVGQQLAKIIRLIYELLDQETASAYIQTVLRYMAAGSDKLSQEDLKTIVLKVIEEGDDLMPTLAQQWVEEGREKGREEGREAALSVLRRLLATRFGVPLDYFDDALQTLDLAAITALSEAAFEADSLAAFEGSLPPGSSTRRIDPTSEILAFLADPP